MRLLHIGIAMMFVAGLVGRNVTFRRAGKIQEVHAVASLLHLSEWFERRLVIPSYFGMLATGVLMAWISRWPLLSAMTAGEPKWTLVSLILFLSPWLVIPTYLLPRRKQRARALADALSQQRVTPELAAAISDPGVRLLRRLEVVLMTVVFVLMVVKPF